MFKKICFITAALLFSPLVSADQKLLFAIDLIRHGDRTPIHEIPAFSHDWKEGPGELTPLGAEQEFKLGQRFRERYIYRFHLLPDQYHLDTLSVRSTDRRRAIMSAEALLRGLYPPDKRPLSCKIIPVKSVPRAQDSLLSAAPSKNIFRLVRDYIDIYLRWHRLLQQHGSDIARWSRLSGEQIDGFIPLVHLADNLHIWTLHHIPLPKGFNQQDVDKLRSLAQSAMTYYSGLKNTYCPMGSEFIQTVSTIFETAVKHPTSQKYILYSAHDSTILAVMSMLGAPMKEIPPYASDLNFSLFKEDHKYFITIRLNDRPVSVPACRGERCTIDALSDLRWRFMKNTGKN